MNTLQIFENQTALEQVRKAFCPTLTDLEFTMFVGLAKSVGANPYTKEIYPIKYNVYNPDTKQKDLVRLQMFCGRDFYRRVAQEQADYIGHNVVAIYKNDIYIKEYINGELKITHKSVMAERGELVGAYCIVTKVARNGEKFNFIHDVLFSEYAQFISSKENGNIVKKLNENWGGKPETMIKKVAESQTLRMAYQGLFAGTYDESEKWADIYGSEKANNTKKIPNEETIENMVAKFKQYQESIQDYFEGVETAPEEVSKVKKKVADLVAYIKYHYILNNEQTLQLQSAILFDDIRINLE